VGIKESPPNSNKVVFNTRYYGKEVSGSSYPWCMAFIWCLFQDIGAPELFYDGKKTASCGELMRWSKTKNQFVANGFQPGDVLFFDFTGKKGAPTHTGIVYETYNGGVRSYEGNTAVGNDSNGGEVMKRERALANITGVFRPAYKEDDIVTYDDFKKFMEQYNAENAAKPESAWSVQEGFISKAKSKVGINGKNITDGTAPQSYTTREQLFAVLGRLGLIK
jgi:hypothetical protein